jgi:hypothetical protein
MTIQGRARPQERQLGQGYCDSKPAEEHQHIHRSEGRIYKTITHPKFNERIRKSLTKTMFISSAVRDPATTLYYTARDNIAGILWTRCPGYTCGGDRETRTICISSRLSTPLSSWKQREGPTASWMTISTSWRMSLTFWGVTSRIARKRRRRPARRRIKGESRDGQNRNHGSRDSRA